MTQFNNQLKINKVHTSNQRGYTLGSTNATWRKIKQATNASAPVNEFDSEDTIIQQGPIGEILMVYPKACVLEIWYWLPPVFGDETTASKDLSGDTLYFYGQVDLGSDADESVEAIDIIEGDLNSNYEILVTYRGDVTRLEIQTVLVNRRESIVVQKLELPELFYVGPLTTKVNPRFIVVGNLEGYLYLFSWDSRRREFIDANTNEAMMNLKKSTCLPILRNFSILTIGDNGVLFKTSCAHSKPIFDLNKNWLVYSPTKAEYNHIRLNQDKITPVKLPTSKPLLNKLLENLSNNALDLLFKISKFSTTKLNEYMNSTDNLDLTIKSLGKSLSKVLNQTVHTLNETKANFLPNDNQIIKIVDLSNDKVLTIFKTPDGVSNLSFNPYDLQLVNSNMRGDSFFIWDLIKLPEEVSLMGRFSRGKTSGVIDEFFWFINNNEDDPDPKLGNDLRGTNSGFGCINSKSGTVHWYNINYLLSNLSNNLPNYLGKEFPINATSSPKKYFLNDWILSASSASGKYKKFIRLPNLLKLSDQNCCELNQLGIIDASNNLKLINPLNGDNCFKYELPTSMLQLDTGYNKLELRTFEKKQEKLIPLSQIEIETCKPFMNLINLKNIEIACYDFDDSKTDIDAFYEMYSNLQNNNIPVKKIKIENVTDSEDSNEFIELLVDDLLIE